MRAIAATPASSSTDRTTAIIEHERAKYVCPLRYPQKTEAICPIQHKRWAKGGCTADRLRYQLDRESERYKEVYRQRTATERINSQAVELGIEQPKLRNRAATPAHAPQRSAGAWVTNQNTLIYVLINLRALQRLRQRTAR
jgi:hypothetical protein